MKNLKIINLVQLRDIESESWDRSDPEQFTQLDAGINQESDAEFMVSLRDTENSHIVEYAKYGGQHFGRCTCPGWNYHDRCAHAVAVARAVDMGMFDAPVVEMNGIQVEVLEREEREASRRSIWREAE